MESAGAIKMPHLRIFAVEVSKFENSSERKIHSNTAQMVAY